MILLSTYLFIGFLVSVFLLSSPLLLDVNKRYRKQFDEEPSKGIQMFAITVVSLFWLPFLCFLSFKAFKMASTKLQGKMIIGLIGYAGSGKSTVAKELVVNHGFTELAFGDNLKKMLAHILDDDIKKYYTDEGKREELTITANYLNDFAGIFGEYLRDEFGTQEHLTFADRFIEVLNEPKMHEVSYTRRELMQLIGTDVVKHLDSDFWINIVLKDAELIEGNVVISDVRFDDEAQAVKTLGGRNAYIERVGVEQMDHSSEKGVSIGLIDVVLHNNFGIEAIPSLVTTLVEGK